MSPVISIKDLSKVYSSGFKALDRVSLDVAKGEIFALLGPNGAGKTTLISIVCGTVSKTSGTVLVGGDDNVSAWRRARTRIGLVPQEISLDIFSTVANCVRFSRGLFGKPVDAGFLEGLLKDLSLWDKRAARVVELSGGMKRRVMIAKALSHEPEILFLDEPTAGVDVNLRRDMWALVRRLRDRGVTIVLTTHYLEEAEEMADRVGVVDKGRLLLVEDKASLMRRLGKRRLTVTLAEPLPALPAALDGAPAPRLDDGGRKLALEFDAGEGGGAMAALLGRLDRAGIAYVDLETGNSSLEDIFVGLVGEGTR
ncbi:MAG: ABC transporter ATP-binding protein [Hyphomicrobiales bacterium]|nr:ABC transporter ATP-binding protein [Hyphomicrobiales bacterium]MDE2017846.1 ABC transporter ATP-binding protein [Hyphomicrobiales bacterium]